MWVRGPMAINVVCEFRDRSSIPRVCQITDADLLDTFCENYIEWKQTII